MIYDSLDTSTLLNTVVLFHQKIQLKNTGKRPFSGGPDQPQLRHDSSSPNPLTVEPKGCTVADGAWEKSKSCCHIDLEVWRFIEELATPNRKKNICIYHMYILYMHTIVYNYYIHKYKTSCDHWCCAISHCLSFPTTHLCAPLWIRSTTSSTTSSAWKLPSLLVKMCHKYPEIKQCVI